MSLWHCQECTTSYSVGAPCCPHCRSENYSEDVVPKSNKSGISYEGHVDISPADKTQPEWVKAEDAPKPVEKPVEVKDEPKPVEKPSVASKGRK